MGVMNQKESVRQVILHQILRHHQAQLHKGYRI